MQTKHQVELLLAKAGRLPNKALGQHFLIDLNLMRLLIDTAEIEKDDVVIEVGCGTGSLTEAIAEKAGSVIGIEYDKVLTEIVAARFSGANNVRIISGDALSSKNAINPLVLEAVKKTRQKLNGRLLLVANLPYNIASAVMINLTCGPADVDAMFVTVQKEVAERMAAPAGSRHYGTLSIILGATGTIEIFRKLGKRVFWPEPEVESAMVSFVHQADKAQRIDDMDIFRQIVALFIGHRRKMLRACVKFTAGPLSGIVGWDDIFAAADIDPKLRGEDISIDDFISIANLCSKKIKSVQK